MRLGYGGNQSNPHRLKYRLGWQEGSTSEESKNFSESEGEGGSGCHRVDGSKGQGQGQRKSGRAEGPVATNGVEELEKHFFVNSRLLHANFFLLLIKDALMWFMASK